MTSYICNKINRIIIRGILRRHYILNPNNKFNFNERNDELEQTHYFKIDNKILNISGPYDYFWENAYYNLKKRINENNEVDIEGFKNLFEIIYNKKIKLLYSVRTWERED
jgi:hypothetical protein